MLKALCTQVPCQTLAGAVPRRTQRRGECTRRRRRATRRTAQAAGTLRRATVRTVPQGTHSLGSVPAAHGGEHGAVGSARGAVPLSVRTGGAAHKERPVRSVKLQRGGEQLDRTLPRASAHGRICLLQARAVAACAADGMFGLQLVLRACLRTLARSAAAALLRAACKGGAPDAQCRRTPAVPIRPRQRNSSSLLLSEQERAGQGVSY